MKTRIGNNNAATHKSSLDNKSRMKNKIKNKV